MSKFLSLLLLTVVVLHSCNPKLSNGLRANDLTKDVEMITNKGVIIIRLSDSTPLHRDNFLRLAKHGYYDSMLFHRVIKNFMIQSGDPNSKQAKPKEQLGNGDPGYSIPAEFRESLFHHKGAIAAAREGDDVNPNKASSGSQFYIVEGKKYSLDLLTEGEKTTKRKMPNKQKEVYSKIGGVPWLDGGYTIFGDVIKGLDVIDSIANVKTDSLDRPINDIRIIKMKLINRVK